MEAPCLISFSLYHKQQDNSSVINTINDNFAPWRVLVHLQVGVASLKEKTRQLTLLKLIFYRNTRSGEHSFDSAAKNAVIFKGLLVDGTGS